MQQLNATELVGMTRVRQYPQLHCCMHCFRCVNHSHLLVHALFLPLGMLHALQLSKYCKNTITVSYVIRNTVAYTAITVTARVFFIR